MHDKAILCYICSWSHVYSLVDGLVPGSSGEWGGVWLVNIVVLPMGLQTPSTPSVLSLTPLLGTPRSFQWLAVNIHLCICEALAEPLRRQLYQAPFSMHFLASTIVSGFGNCIWDESPGGAVSGWPFLQTLLHILSPYLLPWVFCSHSKKDRSIHTLAFLLLEFHVLQIVSWVFWAFELISTYQWVCSFGSVLPHSGWYFLVHLPIKFMKSSF